jgi:UDP-N-acetylglucosamine 2-epimerase
VKVMTIVGTRPEIIRLSAVIKALDACVDHILVHTGQNWDHRLNQIFFDELGLREPDHYLGVAGGHLGETMGNILAKGYEVLLKEQPDALLILGDTNSALAAIPAKRLKIPIFHMEAGNRCFDQNVPEEINRKIVDHISDINLPYTEHSRRYLLQEGFRRDHIFVTGSPMAEVLSEHAEAIAASKVLDDLQLEADKYILLSAHREENVDLEHNFQELVAAINRVAEEYQHPVIYSTHPRARNRIEERGIVFHQLVRNLPPFGFMDYNHLQQHAFCVLSDSGTLSEESSMLDFPAVLIRTSTERPEVMDKGSIVVGGIRAEGMLESIRIVRGWKDAGAAKLKPDDYVDTNVSQKVVNLIVSYTPIINKVTWFKS